MSDHLLVAKERVEQGWKRNKRLGGGREVVKVGKLNGQVVKISSNRV